MSNTVILKKSSVAGKIPISSDLQPAELAVNLIDQKLYSKRTDGTVVLVGVGASIIDPSVNRFSGTGAQTAFTLSAAPVSAKALIVNISGVVQTPDVDFTVSGTTLTFTTAPPAGTNNITVQNLGTAGTVNVPADGSVTAAKMAAGAAVGNLGFTPYNATNPSGFITSSGSITGNAATATNADKLDGYHASSFLMDTAHSFSSSGYQKFSNGMIIQWGTAVGQQVTVTFPIAFPTACNLVVSSQKWGGTDDKYAGRVQWFNTTQTLLWWGRNYTDGAMATTWIAIGY